MARRKKPEPRYRKGETVSVSVWGGEPQQLTIAAVYWNGLTWMYGFENSAMACGEMYLKLFVTGS